MIHRKNENKNLFAFISYREGSITFTAIQTLKHIDFNAVHNDLLLRIWYGFCRVLQA